MTLQPIAASRSRCDVDGGHAPPRRMRAAKLRAVPARYELRGRAPRGLAATRAAFARKLAAELDAGVARHPGFRQADVASGMSPPSSGMSSLVHVIGLMPSETAIDASREGRAFRARGAEARATGSECRGCRARCAAAALRGIVVDEHGFVRRDAMAFEQDAEDARIGLDHAFFARHDDAVEPRQEFEARPLPAERSRPTSW